MTSSVDPQRPILLILHLLPVLLPLPRVVTSTRCYGCRQVDKMRSHDTALSVMLSSIAPLSQNEMDGESYPLEKFQGNPRKPGKTGKMKNTLLKFRESLSKFLRLGRSVQIFSRNSQKHYQTRTKNIFRNRFLNSPNNPWQTSALRIF